MHQSVTLAKVSTARSATELVIPSETAHTVLGSVQRSVLSTTFCDQNYECCLEATLSILYICHTMYNSPLVTSLVLSNNVNNDM
jgi:hypothetical protein